MGREIITMRTAGIPLEAVREICAETHKDCGANISFNYSSQTFTLFTDGDVHSDEIAIKYIIRAIDQRIQEISSIVDSGNYKR